MHTSSSLRFEGFHRKLFNVFQAEDSTKHERKKFEYMDVYRAIANLQGE